MTKRATVMEEGAVGELPVQPTAFDDFVEHEKKAVQEFSKAFAALLPEGLREHGDTAVKEMVEGYRHLFNATLDDVVRRIEGAKFEHQEPDKKTKVPIE